METTDLDEATKAFSKLEGEVKVDQPNANLNQFNGLIKLKGFPTSVKISIDRFIMSGSAIKGTPWAFGLVVYTGQDTKIQQSCLNSRKKVSRIERLVNIYVVFILCLLLFAVVLSTIMSLSAG
jgi:magnesium-transporting ATPase (P-type)